VLVRSQHTRTCACYTRARASHPYYTNIITGNGYIRLSRRHAHTNTNARESVADHESAYYSFVITCTFYNSCALRGDRYRTAPYLSDKSSWGMHETSHFRLLFNYRLCMNQFKPPGGYFSTHRRPRTRVPRVIKMHLAISRSDDVVCRPSRSRFRCEPRDRESAAPENQRNAVRTARDLTRSMNRSENTKAAVSHGALACACTPRACITRASTARVPRPALRQPIRGCVVIIA